MKCEACLDLLEEYLDGEVAPGDQEQISAHLITCTECSDAFGALAAEQEIFARYDREIEVPPFLWTRVAAESFVENKTGWRSKLASFFRTPSLAGGIAVLLLAIAIGLGYVMSRQPGPKENVASKTPEKKIDPAPKTKPDPDVSQPDPKPEQVAFNPPSKRGVKPVTIRQGLDESDVLSSELSYLDIDEQDTAKHIEQTQNLLRSIRNFPVADGDEEIDVTYDKALSRRLLNENVVLRRDAEMKAKFPTKTLLADLEPFLIDIANLPDHARPEDVRVIKERVQKTEIVAALLVYQDRGPNNR